MVGYVTFYFDVDNFTDRVMVVLTTMLVIATIQSTIQAVSWYFNVKRLRAYVASVNCNLSYRDYQKLLTTK